MYYRILHNMVDISIDSFFNLRNNSIVTRGHNFAIARKFCRTDQIRNVFANRVVKIWNSLDFNTVNAETINVFKGLINKTDLNSFIRGHALEFYPA